MTFAQRVINLQFRKESLTVNLANMRCHAVISEPGGMVSGSRLELRVWGMTLDHMNEFTSTGSDMMKLNSEAVAVWAGNANGPMSLVFEGNIISAEIDFTGAPEVFFSCSARSAFFDQISPGAPNSWPGAQNAEDRIRDIATQAGYGFTNVQKAHAVLVNPYVYGSPIEQIRTLARTAAFPVDIKGVSGAGMVTIWPNNGFRDNVTIDLGPETGMVGYPTFWRAGFNVKSEFNPSICNGRAINVSSVIPKANGIWASHAVTHELATQMPEGPWFTTAVLSRSNYVPAN